MKSSQFTVYRLKAALPAILLVTLAIFAGVTMQGQDILKWRRIDSMLTGWDTTTPGLSIAIIRDNQQVFSKSIGMANIGGGITNAPTSSFWIASVTKQFTAAAIFLLEREGKINLKNSVRQYLPELPFIYQPVQVSDLVYHTSGIRDGFVLTALAKKTPDSYTNDNVVKYLIQQRSLNFEPGSQFEYNNSGYVLLAIIIERVSGHPFPLFVKEQIFDPLSLSNSFISGTFPTNALMTKGYKKAGERFATHHFQGNTYGSTGMVTTLQDLTTWARFLHRPDSVHGFDSVVQKLLQPGKTRDGHSLAYAGGLEKLQYQDQIVYEHFGADEGFKAEILYFPDEKLTIIGLTNNESYFGLQKLLYDIFDVIHGKPQQELKTIGEDPANIAPLLYYNPHLPKLIVIQNQGPFAKIGTTIEGGGATFAVLNDSLIGLLPTDNDYFFNPEEITIRDPYNHKPITLPRLPPVEYKTDLGNFVGQYHSIELATTFAIKRSEKGIAFEFLPNVQFQLFRLTDTDFVFEYQGPNFIQFEGNGFDFSREGCRMLSFTKEEQ